MLDENADATAYVARKVSRPDESQNPSNAFFRPSGRPDEADRPDRRHRCAGLAPSRGYWNAITPIQNKDEISALLGIVKRVRPKSLLEIGTASGGTLFLLTRVAAPDAQLFSVDLPDGPFGGGYPAWKLPLFAHSRCRASVSN